MRKDDEVRQKRRQLYWLAALTALAITMGRIAVFHGRDGETAFGSANDRSRWCTVASLVEHGTYAIDSQIQIQGAEMKNRRPWDTIDKVRHVGRDGQQHYYSSKPPLFPTLVAGVYSVVRIATGLTMTEQPIYIPRIVLALVNIPLLGLFLYCTINSIERTLRSHWAKYVATFATCFGTMLLPFSVSLNNHLPAAASTAAVMWIYILACQKLTSTTERVVVPMPIYWWILAGIAAAFTAACELPALSMFALWVVLFWMLERSSLVPFLAGASLVAAAFFGTNWIAHQSLRPPYAHRGTGEYIAELTSEVRPPDEDLVEEVRMALVKQSLTGYESEMSIEPSDEPDRWIVQADQYQYALVVRENKWKLNTWDDWYEYPGTYWKEGVRKGVDLGEPSRLVYLFQITFGHYGIFSLTPIWILVPWALITGLRYGRSVYRRLNLAVLVASVVCLTFYVARPLIDRNYGGVSVCFRWMLWFAPLWLLLLSPVIEDFRGSRWKQVASYALLALSVFSVATSIETPWEHPWIYRFWEFLGWIGG